MNKYLLTKITEEACEVGQAACKVLNYGKSRQRDFIRELADLSAMTKLALDQMTQTQRELFNRQEESRMVREVKKGKV